MNEKKNINLPILCALLLIIITGAVGYLYYRVFFQMPRDITFCVASNETLSYQLFDNQFSHILTTITILIAMFGLAIPLATYFFQQRNFRDDKAEINRIKDKFDQEFNAFRDMKCEFPAMQKDFSDFKDAFPKMQKDFSDFKDAFLKMQEDFEKIKDDFLKKEEKISNIFIALSMTMEDKLDESINKFERIDGVPGNEKRCIAIIYTILADENNLLFSIINSKSKNNIGQITEKLKDLNEKIKRNSQHEDGVKCILNNLPTEKDFISRQDLADWLGADSPEYKNLVEALSIFYDAYDEQSKKIND